MNNFMKAMKFASVSHKFQTRKDNITPYINHPIQVAELISTVGGVSNDVILSAAILHDIIEDTDVSFEELKNTFGSAIADVVMECSDDKSLSKAERKRLQVEKVRYKSYYTKVVKLADKIANMSDILENPPGDWSNERKLAYFAWSKDVIDAGLRGVNPGLEDMFDALYQQRFNLYS